MEGGDTEKGAGKVEDDTTDEIPEDPVTKFMNTIPPDWEAAERHGKANLAIDNSKTIKQYSEDTHCICCQKEIPTDDQFYPIYGSGSNTRLGELGEGFPILFQLMKYLTFLMLFFTVFLFIPVSFMIARMINANDKMKEAIKKESPLTIFSLGSFLKYANPRDNNFIDVKDRKAMITGYMVLVMLSIVVMFFLLIYLRKKIFESADLVD